MPIHGLFFVFTVYVISSKLDWILLALLLKQGRLAGLLSWAVSLILLASNQFSLFSDESNSMFINLHSKTVSSNRMSKVNTSRERFTFDAFVPLNQIRILWKLNYSKSLKFRSKVGAYNEQKAIPKSAFFLPSSLLISSLFSRSYFSVKSWSILKSSENIMQCKFLTGTEEWSRR